MVASELETRRMPKCMHMHMKMSKQQAMLTTSHPLSSWRQVLVDETGSHDGALIVTHGSSGSE